MKKLDLNKGAYIQISGELGKYNSLPIETLIKIGCDLQELLLTIAKYDLPSKEMVLLENFKIELVDFKKGSAVPQFAFSPRIENKVGSWQIHRNVVSEKFENLIEIANSGDYGKIIELYPEPIKRNPIVENLYSFVNDFGSAPVNIVEFDNQNKVIPLYSLKKFKSEIKKRLITDIVFKEIEDKKINEAVGRIKIEQKGKKTKRTILTTYSKDKYSLEYAPEVIIHEDKRYILKHPLRCLFENEDGYFVIQSELLNIIGTGLTEDEAEVSFAEEFNFVYNNLNSFHDSELTSKNILIKSILNQIIDKIE